MCPARDRPHLSPKQEQILEFIRQIIATKGYAPSMREIGDAAGLRSTSSVAHQIRALEGKGYLRSVPTGPRTSVVTLPTESTKPVAKEDPGPPRQLRGCPDVFVQRITGEPLLNGPHGIIAAGDVLVFRRQSTAKSGDVAAVLTDGGHVVLAHTRSDTEGLRPGESHPGGARVPAILGIVREILSGIRDSAGLTEKREAILSFIRSATQEHGLPPSQNEIGEAVGLAKSSVNYQLQVLEEMGYLRCNPGRLRSVVLVTRAVESAKPAVKKNSGPPRQLRGCPDIFLQRMTGKPLSHGPQGMITDGDLLVVKRQHTAADGDLAAVLNKGRPVLAAVRKNAAGHRFMEANPDAVRMDDVVLLGVVVAVTSDC
ncbi:winged helix-turn-helix transcriptional regulator [Streptomyces niveus]|uniref:LexA family protein n=1 Tax=Streptomyces niveus TaxID=193462 RepID=UPI003417FC19